MFASDSRFDLKKKKKKREEGQLCFQRGWADIWVWNKVSYQEYMCPNALAHINQLSINCKQPSNQVLLSLNLSQVVIMNPVWFDRLMRNRNSLHILSWMSSRWIYDMSHYKGIPELAWFVSVLLPQVVQCTQHGEMKELQSFNERKK